MSDLNLLNLKITEGDSASITKALIRFLDKMVGGHPPELRADVMINMMQSQAMMLAPFLKGSTTDFEQSLKKVIDLISKLAKEETEAYLKHLENKGELDEHIKAYQAVFNEAR